MRTIAALAVGLALATPCARAADAGEAWRAFEDSIRSAEQAREAGDPARAEALYREAIERSKRFGERNLRLARAVDGLADLYYAEKRYDEAEPLYLRSLDLWKDLLGPEQPRLATTMHNLGALYLAQGDLDRAEPLFRRSLEIWENSFGADSAEAALSLDANAALLQRRGRWEEAQVLIERAREIRER